MFSSSDLANEEVTVKVNVLGAGGGAVGDGHGSLVFDVHRQRIVFSLVKTEVEREGLDRGRAEGDMPFSGGLPEPFRVVRTLRRGNEFRIGGGEGVGVLLGAAPVHHVSFVGDGYARPGVACAWARFSVTVHPGFKVQRGTGGEGRVGKAKVGLAFEEVAKVLDDVHVMIAFLCAARTNVT